MVNTTASQILNAVDNECFTLYAEFFDTYFKVLLLKAEAIPLTGEMSTKVVNDFSGELSKSNECYLSEVKEAFCGKNTDIKFFIRDKTFEWKQKDIWTLGKMTLSPVSDIKVISETFRQLLNHHRGIQEKLIVLENENKCLKDLRTKLTTDIEEMIRIKTTIEHDLCRKFLLILNAKKEKIRELKATMKETDTAFDAITDQSEESEEENDKVNNVRTKSTETEKRKSMEKSNYENKSKVRRTDCNINGNGDGKKIITSPKPSTSKTDLNEINNSTKNSLLNNDSDREKQRGTVVRKSTNLINFLEEEAEEELFSQ